MTEPSLPERTEVDATIKHITDRAPRTFLRNYQRSREELVNLYNKGVSSQWNSLTELDWNTDVDPEKLVKTASQPNPIVDLVRAAAEVKGSPFANWSEGEFVALGIEVYKAQLSQFMHGEQGAMMAAAKIVEVVPWIDAKYYAATQTMDEARHTEVFSRYLMEKLGGAYPMNPDLEAQITALVEDGRWDITYLGMQIVIESLALAAFGTLAKTVEEPLLKKLLRYVMADEARHVAFGILSLREYYDELTDAELKDRQDFLAENTLRSRNRSVDAHMWERIRCRPGRRASLASRSGVAAGPECLRDLQPRVPVQARAQRPEAWAARRERRLPPASVGRCRTAEVRVRRRHSERVRDVRRRGAGSRGRDLETGVLSEPGDPLCRGRRPTAPPGATRRRRSGRRHTPRVLARASCLGGSA